MPLLFSCGQALSRINDQLAHDLSPTSLSSSYHLLEIRAHLIEEARTLARRYHGNGRW